MGSASFLPSVLPEPLAPRDEPVRGLRLVTRRNKRPKQGRVSGLLPHVISPPTGSAKVFHNSFVDSRGDENKYKKTSNGLFVCGQERQPSGFPFLDYPSGKVAAPVRQSLTSPHLFYKNSSILGTKYSYSTSENMQFASIYRKTSWAMAIVAVRSSAISRDEKAKTPKNLSAPSSPSFAAAAISAILRALSVSAAFIIILQVLQPS